MRILLTISDTVRLAVILDLESGARQDIPVIPEFFDLSISGRATCHPFGITWTNDELFIANNRQLLVFNKAFNYMRMERIALQPNMHQIIYKAGHIWSVSTSTDSLIIVSLNDRAEDQQFDLRKNLFTPYLGSRTSEERDVNHFNSLLWADESLYVSAHNLGKPSFIVAYEAETMITKHVDHNVGQAIHGLAYADDELFWISTGTAEIRSSRGYSLLLFKEGYARGFAMTHNYFIVATSEFLSRDQRWGGDSWVHVIDRISGRLLSEHHLSDTGSVNDLRILDEFDFAHRVHPFL